MHRAAAHHRAARLRRGLIWRSGGCTKPIDLATARLIHDATQPRAWSAWLGAQGVSQRDEAATCGSTVRRRRSRRRSRISALHWRLIRSSISGRGLANA